MPRNTRVVRAASADIDAAVYTGCDVVLVDPPRAGNLQPYHEGVDFIHIMLNVAEKSYELDRPRPADTNSGG